MTNDNNTQIAADLRAAAGLIRVGGLVYGQYYSKRRPGPTAYCAVGHHSDPISICLHWSDHYARENNSDAVIARLEGVANSLTT